MLCALVDNNVFDTGTEWNYVKFVSKRGAGLILGAYARAEAPTYPILFCPLSRQLGV